VAKGRRIEAWCEYGRQCLFNLDFANVMPESVTLYVEGDSTVEFGPVLFRSPEVSRESCKTCDIGTLY
jgi:hypothetical protein